MYRNINREVAAFLLPLGMNDTFNGSWNNVAMIPSVVVISTTLFGIKEIGTQLEEHAIITVSTLNTFECGKDLCDTGLYRLSFGDPMTLWVGPVSIVDQ